MRMRKKKNLLPRMEACSSLLVADPRALRGRWRELLPGARELRVELGCGKGRFTAETAAAEPDVPEFFAPGEVDRIYINFCDPWPRSNQKKRRLTHGNFLQLYRRVLPLGGEIHFKSDNDKLFEWSLEEIPRFGFRLSQVTRDLHAGGPVGVMTDYEAKFYQQGVTINRCVATMVPWEAPAEAEEEEV